MVKFLNRKDAENVLANKKKFRDVDISKILTDTTEVMSEQSAGVENEWRNVVNNSRKRKKLILCLYYKRLYCLVKVKKTEGLVSNLWVFNGTIHMREIHNSRVIDITHESDI